MYVKVCCFSRFYQINASVINCCYLTNIAWVCILMLNLTPWFTENIIICIIIHTSHPLITWWTNTRLVLVAVVYCRWTRYWKGRRIGQFDMHVWRKRVGMEVQHTIFYIPLIPNDPFYADLFWWMGYRVIIGGKKILFITFCTD